LNDNRKSELFLETDADLTAKAIHPAIETRINRESTVGEYLSSVISSFLFDI
jgi:hypothetical protein